MTDDQLQALAARLLNHAAMHDSVVPNDDELRQWRDDLIAAAKYLRQWAEAEPVATVRVHNTGGNAGIAWSGVPTEHAGTMRGGTPLYANPQPQQAGVPEGWKLVPVEPTVEMRRAGTAANDGIVSDIYRATLAAAPQPPSAQAEPTIDINIKIAVPANWSNRLDMQWIVEREIHADRWSWSYAAPQAMNTQADAIEALRWEKPGPVSPNHPLECLIVLSALRQSDGDWWIRGDKFLADYLPIAWAPDTPEARAVLAAQGGGNAE